MFAVSVLSFETHPMWTYNPIIDVITSNLVVVLTGVCGDVEATGRTAGARRGLWYWW